MEAQEAVASDVLRAQLAAQQAEELAGLRRRHEAVMETLARERQAQVGHVVCACACMQVWGGHPVGVAGEEGVPFGPDLGVGFWHPGQGRTQSVRTHFPLCRPERPSPLPSVLPPSLLAHYR